MEYSSLGLSSVPASVEFTDKLLFLPRLVEIGLSLHLAGLPVSKTLGKLECIPGSFTELSREPSHCWIERGTPVMKYQIVYESLSQEKGWFKDRTKKRIERKDVEIRSPISGMIVGFRDSDSVTQSTRDGIETKNKWGTMIPIILIPKDEPRPSICGYNEVVETMRARRKDLMISEYSERGWAKLEFVSNEEKQVLSELESYERIDENQFIKAKKIDAKRDSYIIKSIDSLRSKDSSLSS